MFCLVFVRGIRDVFPEGSCPFECQFEGVGSFGIAVCQQGCFGHKHIVSGCEPINMGEKMGTQETFGAVALDGVAYFFTGDKSDTILGGVVTIKEDKERGMPGFSGTLVDRIKLTGVSQAVEVFYTANRFRPLARRALMTLRPFLVFIRVRKPWVRLRGVLWG